MSNYTMRPLMTMDVFRMSKILKKMDLKLEIKDGMTQEQVGAQVIQQIAENLHQAEEEVNGFLADLVGIEAKKFAKLPIEETLEIFTLFKGQKGIMNFLKLAGK
ncbi:hypothetical protein [Sporosarcina sp. OR05]|uniref:hypothetical protein n=1 Tax=Sporosarcina sp. OR05 TaxID=2969819 RepID=UPI00352B1F0F